MGKSIFCTGCWLFLQKSSIINQGNKQPLEVFCEKKVFLKILQNSQKTAVPESIFNKVTGLRFATLLAHERAVFPIR